MSANLLSLELLREFAPANSPLFAYRLESTGSPMHDWAHHIAAHDLHRRELEETSLLGGNLVVRAVEGDEKPALERVKILSLQYATRVFGNIEDAKEFIRCVQAIADPRAAQFELEQIAGFYYRECRQRETADVLKEMGLLGMEMELVTTELKDRIIEYTEKATGECKLTPADEKRVRLAQKNLPPLPLPTPNFDTEMRLIEKRLSRSRITQAVEDEYAAYYLSDEGKTLSELDEDYRRFDSLEQYTEDGLVGLQMSGSSHTEVVLELNAEVTADYLPETVQPLAKILQLIFVGHEIGGRAAQIARHFTAARKIENLDQLRAREAFRLNIPFIETPHPELSQFTILPLTRTEISEWIDLQLDLLYSREVVRSARRFGFAKDGTRQEWTIKQTVNPEFEEKQYASGILHLLLEQMEQDFHLSSLRRNEIYQSIYLQIRRAQDTAILTSTAEIARRAKDEKRLNLKEYTTLSTIAKSQFGRLNNNRPSPLLYRLEKEIGCADSRKISYLKWAMYGSNLPAHPIHKLPKQEVQRAWTALRSRDLSLKQKAAAERQLMLQQHLQFNQSQVNSQVKVSPTIH